MWGQSNSDGNQKQDEADCSKSNRPSCPTLCLIQSALVSEPVISLPFVFCNHRVYQTNNIQRKGTPAEEGGEDAGNIPAIGLLVTLHLYE